MSSNARHSAESAARLTRGPAMDFLDSIVPTPGADVDQGDYTGAHRAETRKAREDRDVKRLIDNVMGR